MYKHLLIFCVVLTACGQAYESVNDDLFNQQIQFDTQLKSATEVMLAYYHTDHIIYPEQYSVEEEELAPGKFKVTLIEENMQDDSMEAKKVIMQVIKTQTGWYVESILENWRCWDGRGHTNWGIEYCN